MTMKLSGTKLALGRMAATIMGRSRLERASRFFLNVARHDSLNDPRLNGEYLLQRWFARTASDHPLTIFDVGANVGDWTTSMIEALSDHHDFLVYAFEPCQETYQTLTMRLQDSGLISRVRTRQVAVTDRIGTVPFISYGKNMGRNSIFPVADLATEHIEHVPAATLDAICLEAKLTHIDFLKIDTEGNDQLVLEGASQLVQEKRIGVIQFEYNYRWIYARRYLRDSIELAGRTGYRFGKLAQRGVLWMDSWHPKDESFQEGNYVICRPDLSSSLPSVSL